MLALSGIRVVDLTTNIAGPFATMVLADLGAEVWKIERPGTGDDARGMGPFLPDGTSCYFLAINRGKRSVAVDIRRPEGREIVLALAARSHVFVENLRAGKAAELGLGYDDVRAVQPGIVYCSLSAFGEEGPEAGRPGYDALVQARTGIMSVTGMPGGPPVRVGVSLNDMGSGLWAALGIVTALVTGRGQRVTTSLLETALGWMAYHLLYWQATGRNPGPQGTRHPAFAPYGDFPTADGAVLIGISNDRQFQRLCQAAGHAEWASDARFATNAARLEHRDELEGLLSEALRQRPSRDWVEAFRAYGVPVERLQRVSDVLQDPQVEALGMLEGGLVRLPLTFSGRRPPIPGGAPALGQDTEAALELVGLDRERRAELARTGVIGGMVRV